METFQIQRTIKYEADRVKGFGREVMSVPGCEELERCIQCGTCSGVCPLSIYMDYTPRQVMNLTRSDFKNEVLKSHTIWLCASCYACTVECPQEIGITDIMYELKQRAIKEGVYPKKFAIPVLAQEFYKMVKEYGRISEMKLVQKLFLKTNPLEGLKMWRLGIDLMAKHGIGEMFKTETVKDRAGIHRMLDTLDQTTTTATTSATKPVNH